MVIQSAIGNRHFPPLQRQGQHGVISGSKQGHLGVVWGSFGGRLGVGLGSFRGRFRVGFFVDTCVHKHLKSRPGHLLPPPAPPAKKKHASGPRNTISPGKGSAAIIATRHNRAGGQNHDDLAYAYDRNFNRTYNQNTQAALKDDLHQYDDLNRLTAMDRGTLNGNKDGITGTPNWSDPTTSCTAQVSAHFLGPC